MKHWKRIGIITAIIFAIALTASYFYLSQPIFEAPSKLKLDDVSGLNATDVNRVFDIHSVNDIKDAIRRAKRLNHPISIAGKKHSQGGQTLATDSTHLNMLPFNKILALDEKRKTITVQSGVSWQQIQEYINSYNLSVKVMQSSNIFTVGGSLSVNAHGRDPHYGPIIETVTSFHMVLANGKTVNVSRNENPKLFSAAIGGYGLLGVIIDVTLSLTENNLLGYQSYATDYDKFTDYLIKNLLKPGNHISLLFARMSIIPDESFLKKMYIVWYKNTEKFVTPPSPIKTNTLKQDLVYEPFFNISRKSMSGKKIRWEIENSFYSYHIKKVITRNNAMNPPVKFLLDYKGKNDSDTLQEYCIPVSHFKIFIDGLRNISKEYTINLLNVTLRYEPKNNAALLSYTKNDSIAVVLYININHTYTDIHAASLWTRELVDLALKQGGTYYLAYQTWPTKEQLLQAYPNFGKFQQLKNKLDPEGLFTNQFYQAYQ